jgi:hypothetical protein
MKVNIDKQASRIADAIVELVERTDGSVTLARVAREVAGFAKDQPPTWSFVIEHNGVEKVYWAGMTEAGSAALQKVMYGRRVAVQFVSLLPYLLEHSPIHDEHWQPIVLLPARAANLDSSKWLVRAPHDCVAIMLSTPGWRSLKPGPVRFTADQFSV